MDNKRKEILRLVKTLSCLVLTLFLILEMRNTVYADYSKKVLEFNKEVLENNSSYPAVLKYYLEMDGDIDRRMDGYSKAIEKKAKEITTGLSTEYEKSKAIHDWVSTNLWYNYDYVYHGGGEGVDNSDAGDVFKKKLAVCEGFATLTLTMHRAVGIPCKMIHGSALGPNGSDLHSWNEVYVGDRWIIVDTTWDCNNRYEYGEYSEQIESSSDYFDPSIEKFSEKHRYNFYDSIIYTDHYFNKYKDNTVKIPEGFTDLAYDLFYNDDAVKKIILPDTIREIKYGEFRECYNLQEIRLSSILKEIPNEAFRFCYKLKEVVIPSSVTKIGDYAFSGCDSLTKIIIPESVKKIGKNAFGKEIVEGDGFREVHYPKKLTIYGVAGSAAHKYAIKNKIKFKELK
jgi:hypothetical protein